MIFFSLSFFFTRLSRIILALFCYTKKCGIIFYLFKNYPWNSLQKVWPNCVFGNFDNYDFHFFLIVSAASVFHGGMASGNLEKENVPVRSCGQVMDSATQWEDQSLQDHTYHTRRCNPTNCCTSMSRCRIKRCGL